MNKFFVKQRIKAIFILFAIIMFIICSVIGCFPVSPEVSAIQANSMIFFGIEVENINIDDTAEISVKYPRTKNEIINQNIKRFVENKIAEFKKGVNSDKSKKDQMQIEFKLFKSNYETISILFETIIHRFSDPVRYSYLDAQTYNHVTGKRIELDSLFRSEKYIKVFSNAVKDELASKAPEKKVDIKNIIKSQSQSHENFIIDDDKLVIYFEDSQFNQKSFEYGRVELKFSDLGPELLDKLIPSAKTTNITSEPKVQSTTTVIRTPASTHTETTHPKKPEYEGKKLIALTFDDGPHGIQTPRLLEILKTFDVKATFFVLGSNAKLYPKLLKQQYDDGHQIGNHTYNHKKLKRLYYKSKREEIENSAKTIETITGEAPAAFRPPYGEYDEAVQELSSGPVILWSLDPMDWKYRDSEAICNNVMNSVNDGDIILLHDIHRSTVDAVAMLIPKLQNEGYCLVTVEDLFNERGKEIENGKVYSSARPKK